MNKPATPPTATTAASSSAGAPVRAVLFDLDDTLWAIEPVLVRAENLLFDWMQANAPRVTQHHSIASLRQRRLELMEREPAYRINLWALRHAVLTEVFQEHEEDHSRVDEAMALFSEARNAVTLFDDVLPALQLLKQGLALGTVSNGFADLKHIGLDGHFQVSIAAHTFGRAKPDPSIFLAACEALQVTPQHTVYVGDDLMLDVQGAQQAGLRAVWMNRFERELPPHVKPDAVCSNLHDLQRWLAALESQTG
jgi:putative hydrolase of the HAD superfamily